MKQVTLGRKLFILAVTLICLRLVYPSVRYLIALRETAPTGAEELKKWDEKLESLRESAIPLGLDLRGGVDVSLMIDEDEAVKSSVQNMVTTLKTDFADKKVSVAVGATTDGKKLSVKVLDKADARAVYNALGNYAGQIEGDFSQAKLETGEEILLTMNERSRQQNMKNNIEGAMRVIRERLDKFGLTQPSIAIQGGNRLRIQVAGEKDPDRLIGNITKLAAMEFRLAHEAYGTASDPINSLLDENGELKPDAIVPLGYEVIPYNFRKVDPKTDQISSRKGKMLVEREVKIRGDELRNTGFHQDPMDIANPIKVDIQFKDHGAKIFGDITTDSSEKAKQDGHARNLAIILDGEVISAPEMKVPITSGSAVIEGGFRQADAQDLSQLLKAGSLPAPLKVESKRTVGASLGTESIFGGVRALVYGTVVIIIFMIAYYGVAGVISIIALILNVLIVLAILQLAKATLTLSGIGGILLTVGMAVDTNVLIYERMREELAAGRPLKQAIALGFDRAFAVIIDSHMTTLVTALLLLQFTEGSVFGFALTMTFGIIANLYTGLIVTYTLCAMWFQWRNSLSLGKLKIFANASFDFIKMRFVTLGISWLIIIAGSVMVFGVLGLKRGVDFKGGILAEVSFANNTTENDIRDLVREAGLKGERVQNVAGTNDYIVRVEAKKSNGKDDPEGTEATLREGLEKKYSGQYTIKTMTNFGPETSQEFISMAVTVTFLASLAILIYLWFRFELVFGVAAIVALVHDLLMTVVLSQLWGVEITLDVVASLMVLLGFSTNDTIVIFDRIRENTRKHPSMPFGEICNRSMNESLSRTIITSGTVFMVVTVMLLIGGEGLAPFAKIMFIGSVVGTYSSDFIAAPVVYMWNQYKKNKVVAALTTKKAIGPEKAKNPEQKAKERSGSNVPRTRI